MLLINWACPNLYHFRGCIDLRPFIWFTFSFQDADPTKCTYSLNMDFSSKRTKLKITAAVQRETPQVCTVTYSYIQLHTVTYSYIQLQHTVTYSYIQLHTVTYSYIQLHTVTYSYIQLHTVTYSYIQLHTVTYNYCYPVHSKLFL